MPHRALEEHVRERLVRSLSLVEDVVYIGLGVLLSASAFALLVMGGHSFIVAVMQRTLADQFVALLDEILEVLLVIELLYTVQVSFREHALAAEPFLVVAMIAVVRRILVLTAELPKLPQTQPVFSRSLVELALLPVMIVVLVGSLVALQKQAHTGRG